MSIEDMWNLLDEVWFELGCTQNSDEQELSKYYSHPVWVLNGIHIENNQQSLQAREDFTSWIIENKFKRIADFGGGFGTLGRMINSKDPSIEINIIEPNYQRFVDKSSMQIRNLTYSKDMNGKYDLIIATDVFEHVRDPIAILNSTCNYLKKNSYYLIANCFRPVIQCHLIDTFHFHASWQTIVEKIGLTVECSISDGTVFRYNGISSLEQGRKIEKFSKNIYFLYKYAHPKIQKRVWQTLFKSF